MWSAQHDVEDEQFEGKVGVVLPPLIRAINLRRPVARSRSRNRLYLVEVGAVDPDDCAGDRTAQLTASKRTSEAVTWCSYKRDKRAFRGEQACARTRAGRETQRTAVPL